MNVSHPMLPCPYCHGRVPAKGKTLILGKSEHALLMAVIDYTENTGFHPTRKVIAELSGISLAQVYVLSRKLQARGYVEASPASGGTIRATVDPRA